MELILMVDEEELPNVDWAYRFLNLATHISSWSKDPSTKVGCVITDSQRRILSMGYNGFPRGVDDNPARYDNRDLKYQMVQHAEANAVLQSRVSVEGSTVYVTHKPCSSCSGLLIQAGVSTIITFRPSEEFYERYKDNYEIADRMLWEAGVDLFYLITSSVGNHYLTRVNSLITKNSLKSNQKDS